MLHLLRRKTTLKYCIAALLFLDSTGSVAQIDKPEMNRVERDYYPYYFGITLGVNLARFQTYLHPNFLQQDSVFVAEPTNSGGFTLGLSATARLSNRFQARFNPQLMFIERGIIYKLNYNYNGDSSVTKKVESVIFSFPLQIKFQSDRIGNFRVYTLAGLKFDIDMASNARAHRAEDLLKIQKYDYGPEFGIGFNFYFEWFTFSPEIKISTGLRNIHSRDPNLIFSSVFDKIQSRMIIFSFHIE